MSRAAAPERRGCLERRRPRREDVSSGGFRIVRMSRAAAPEVRGCLERLRPICKNVSSGGARRAPKAPPPCQDRFREISSKKNHLLGRFLAPSQFLENLATRARVTRMSRAAAPELRGCLERRRPSCEDVSSGGARVVRMSRAAAPELRGCLERLHPSCEDVSSGGARVFLHCSRMC